MIERRHKPIINALSKMLDDGSTNWIQKLFAVLWADQSTIHISTNFTPYYICYGSKPVIFIKIEVSIWQILP